MATIVGKNKTTETLTGGADNDTLIGGAGTNTLIGGAGADIFRVSARSTSSGSSRDIIADFQLGVDKIDVSAWGVSSFDQLEYFLQYSDFQASFRANYGGEDHVVEISNIVHTDLSASDFIFSTSGTQSQTGTASADVLFGSAQSDTLNGAGGGDTLFGGNGDDVLKGGLDDLLFGGAGADTFIAEATGDVRVWGQGGSDTFKVSARLGGIYDHSHMTINDFMAGQDKIDVSAFGISSFDQLVLIIDGTSSSIYFDAFYGDAQHVVDATEGTEGTFGTLRSSDFIFDTSGAKTLIGTGERDRLFGSAFNDTISGGDGDDQIFGGVGNDMISGGAGDNWLYGQAGADTFKIDRRTEVSTTNVVWDFQRGLDRIDVSAWGISSFDQLKSVMRDQGAGTSLEVTYGGENHQVEIRGVLPGKLTATDFIFYTGSGARTQTGTKKSDTLFGGGGSDTLKGGGGGDDIYGGAGDDVISGGTDYNTLRGDAGADTFRLDQRIAHYTTTTNVIVDFQIGVDKIDVSAWGISSWSQLKPLLQTFDGGSEFKASYGGSDYEVQINKVAPGKLAAKDFIFYSGGGRTQTGTADSDLLFGGAGADTLNGAADSDHLYGGDGNDIIIGGEGADTLYGQGGADTFRMVQKDSARDIIVDFQVGSDRIDLSTSGVTGFDQLKYLLKVLDTGTTFRIYNKSYDQDVWILNVAPGKLTARDFIFDKQDLKTQTAKDTGSTLFGGKGANTLLGGAGADKLFGGAGDDILFGGLGDDTLYGQAGADTFKVATRVGTLFSANFTTIADFQAGVDKLDVSGFGITSFEQLKLVMFDWETETSISASYGSIFSVTLTGVKPSQLTAGDFIFATQEARKISGTREADALFGGKASDRLSGGAGDDKLFGGAGSDTLIGGDGINDLYGQGGADVFKASKVVLDWDEEDTVHDFQVGLDKIDLSAIGLSSFDQLQAIMYEKDGGTFFYAFRDYGNFRMLLKDVLPTDLRASDFIFDKQTAKTETGGSTPDMLFGTTQGDKLNGGDDSDRIFGGGGNDKLLGGGGSDMLFGGAGADTLAGGQDMDRFLFLTLGDSGTSSSSRDTILDFSIADGDRMNVYMIDANTKKVGNQAFSFIGKSAFTDTAGELRYVKATSDTYIYGDVNGDGKADFSIRLDDAMTLTKDQFIL